MQLTLSKSRESVLKKSSISQRVFEKLRSNHVESLTHTQTTESHTSSETQCIESTQSTHSMTSSSVGSVHRERETKRHSLHLRSRCKRWVALKKQERQLKKYDKWCSQTEERDNSILKAAPAPSPDEFIWYSSRFRTQKEIDEIRKMKEPGTISGDEENRENETDEISEIFEINESSDTVGIDENQINENDDGFAIVSPPLVSSYKQFPYLRALLKQKGLPDHVKGTYDPRGRCNRTKLRPEKTQYRLNQPKKLPDTYCSVFNPQNTRSTLTFDSVKNSNGSESVVKTGPSIESYLKPKRPGPIWNEVLADSSFSSDDNESEVKPYTPIRTKSRYEAALKRQKEERLWMKQPTRKDWPRSKVFKEWYEEKNNTVKRVDTELSVLSTNPSGPSKLPFQNLFTGWKYVISSLGPGEPAKE